LLGALLLVFPGCRPTLTPSPATSRSTSAPVEGRTEAPEPVSRLLGLMRDRLLLMHDVARSKWDARRPVSDPERERDLLAEMERLGKERGLDTRFTRAFFAAQIGSAKRIQEGDLARWQVGEPVAAGPAPDLAVLRRRIDELNRQLVAALAQSGPWPVAQQDRERVRDGARQAIVGEGIDDTIRDAAIAPLVTDP
jgi:chorismate mutase